ncbi:hypothetical protein SAMN04488058_101291 [Deinococcus reticulitermitis]|uniref:Lipoprotein n=1 Tax=Deinococcus reticulitermitis TaxID=856736 RepID=A0A1H6SSD0_9DEIO|nr:hypothetical protein [Deinococcus reticulitermitis]SEI66825.1 hypothetical protein SAMN04488058_101291 [Deinococcus reticulitermitis]
MERTSVLICAALLTACAGRGLKAPSAILGVELPGALVAERGKERITNTVQQMAVTFDQECGPVETFEVADSARVRAAINGLVGREGYTRRLIVTVEGGEAYALSGPKRLLVVDTESSLGVCELLS